MPNQDQPYGDSAWNAPYPNQNSGQRTAGAGTGIHTPDGGEVRDWQRNTWYGPAPSDVNPFDEPEDAPELRENRSENVNSRLGDFWKQQNTGYTYTGAQPVMPEGRGGRAKRSSGKREQLRTSTVFKGAMITLAVFLVAVLILRFVVFTVRDIQVTGNRDIAAAEIVRISGIRQGESILSLQEETVERHIEADYRLQFRYMEKRLPNCVVLSVKERENCCWLTYGGILYTLDKNRMVMFETEDLNVRPATLVEVKGLAIRSGCRVGQTLVLSSSEQQLVFSELFLEMKVLNCTADIQEADLSDLNSIILFTRDGYTVSLGNNDNLHAKLRAMLLVRQKLRELEKSGGTIHVSTPETPYYSPPAVNPL